jgi:hypothetical protein
MKSPTKEMSYRFLNQTVVTFGRRRRDQSYSMSLGPAKEEMDLEGIAVDAQTVFVLSSHSARRKKTDKDKAYEKNRAALMSSPEAQPARDVLLRFELDAAGKAGPIERTSLRGFLDATEPFKSFDSIASKENGIDAEGLAVWDQKLYIGFRGPVLRGNFTPILRCRFGSPIAEPEVLFVNLGGRGARDLAGVNGGLLILAGPVWDGPGSYQLYLWDGRDGVPGKDAPTSANSELRLIGDLPIPGSDAGGHKISAKPEGLAVIKESSHDWEILIVFDGLKDGHATRFSRQETLGRPSEKKGRCPPTHPEQPTAHRRSRWSKWHHHPTPHFPSVSPCGSRYEFSKT